MKFNSVHLQNFTKLDFLKIDSEIVKKMDETREICNCVLSLRKEFNIRVRMPLKKITICGNTNLDDQYFNIIKQETNVKNIEIFNENIDKIAEMEVSLNMRECGKIFGSKLKDILFAQKNKDWKILDGKLNIAGCTIDKDLYNVIYKSKDGLKMSSCENFNLLVMIDTEQTEELIIEGIARDLIRVIQQKRKDLSYEINDRIKIEINTEDSIFNKVFEVWKNYISEQTLSKEILINKNINNNDINDICGYKFSFSISKFE